jgi:hypothetical protein
MGAIAEGLIAGKSTHANSLCFISDLDWHLRVSFLSYKSSHLDEKYCRISNEVTLSEYRYGMISEDILQ